MFHAIRFRINEETLALLITALEEYKDDGVYDPWVLSDGRHIQPLDALYDLRDAIKFIKETG
jgi:hypothetical protein